MLNKIKSIAWYQWAIGILISLLIFLVAAGWAQTDKRIDSKADSARVVELLDDLKEQRAEDKQDLKDQRAEDQQDLKEQRALDQKTNENMYKLILESIKKGKYDG